MINGIKPDISKKTLLNSKTEFGEAMDKFLNKLTENAIPYVERFNHMKNVTFKVDGGRKFLKIKYYSDKINTDYENLIKYENTNEPYKLDELFYSNATKRYDYINTACVNSLEDSIRQLHGFSFVYFSIFHLCFQKLFGVTFFFTFFSPFLSLFQNP